MHSRSHCQTCLPLWCSKPSGPNHPRAAARANLALAQNWPIIKPRPESSVFVLNSLQKHQSNMTCTENLTLLGASFHPSQGMVNSSTLLQAEHTFEVPNSRVMEKNVFLFQKLIPKCPKMCCTKNLVFCCVQLQLVYSMCSPFLCHRAQMRAGRSSNMGWWYSADSKRNLNTLNTSIRPNKTFCAPQQITSGSYW